MADKFYIAAYDKQSGLTNNVKPYLIPDQAFSQLTNAYVFRGRVRKRFGSRWMGLGTNQLSSRLRVSIGTTDGAGSVTARVPVNGNIPYTTAAIGQAFSIGTEIFTVYQLLGAATPMYRSGAATLATFDTTSGNATSGQVIITGAASATIIYFYPALPVMGLLSQEGPVLNDEPVIAFDTRFAYQYSGNGWDRLGTGIASTWSGQDYQYFWSVNWTGTSPSDQVFFVTNNNPNEASGMRYLTAGAWNAYHPLVNDTAGNIYLWSSALIVSFKNRLIAMGTWEGTAAPGTNYDSRLRWSWINSPLDANAWLDTVSGKGGGLDAPTTEAIITAQFVKDRLIIFFERSTYELVYTQNDVQPFAFQKINNELGAESTFSVVPFDRVALGIGNSGVHACNGNSVERIDSSIPEEVFKIHNVDQGVYRVYGIRDYTTEMVYWTFPDEATSNTQPYPNKVLMYNYSNGTWAYVEDAITCFGYYQSSTGVTWDSSTVTWDQDVSWDSGASLAAQVREIIGGNQQGYVFHLDANCPTNAAVLQITALTVDGFNNVSVGCVNHNLRVGEYVMFTGITGTGNLSLLNYNVYEVVNVNVNSVSSDFVCAYLGPNKIAGTYTGAGVMQRVSNINILTKEYNFYADQGKNAFISKIDFMVDKTDNGQLQVDYYVSTNINSMLNDSAGTGSLLGTGTLDTFPYTDLYPYEAFSARLWHPVYIQADGECIALNLYMDNTQMLSITTDNSQGSMTYTGPAFEDFQLNAICITAQPTASRLQ